MTQQPDILQSAKQGNPKAIAALINRQLQSKGIKASATAKDNELKVLLEADQIPPKETLVPFIEKGIRGLQIQSIKQLYIVGKKGSQDNPVWTELIKLESDLSISTPKSQAKPNNSPKVPSTLASKPYKEKINPIAKIGKFAKGVALWRLCAIACVSIVVAAIPLGYNLLRSREEQQATLKNSESISQVPNVTDVKSLDQLKQNLQSLKQSQSLLEGIRNHPGSLYPQAQAQLKVIKLKVSEYEKKVHSEESAVLTLEAARKQIETANKLIEDPPLPPDVWVSAQTEVYQAVERLKLISKGYFVSNDAKKELPDYEKQLTLLTKRVKVETQAADKFKLANQIATEAQKLSDDEYRNSISDLEKAKSKWQQVARILKEIQSSSYIGTKSQEYRDVVEKNHKTLVNVIAARRDCIKKKESEYLCDRSPVELASLPDSAEILPPEPVSSSEQKTSETSSSSNSSSSSSTPTTDSKGRTLLGTGPTGYTLWLGTDKCIYVKDLTEGDLARLGTDVWKFKKALKQETGATCVFYE